MAGCAHCGGCCAHCATACGVMGGASFGAMGAPFIGGFGGFGFFPFFGGHSALQSNDDNATPVDGDALVDPNHPGHREAIKTIAHVDDDKHEKITQWLKNELHQFEHGSDPKQS
jgi:hypothetical protein